MNTIAEQIEKDGYVLTLSVGVSMKPMLTQRTEQLMIEKIAAPPKRNDVVLFTRSNGRCVLHRVIRKRQDAYLIRGDNCYDREWVLPSQIIGILKGYYRGDQYICCETNRGYRCYVFFWRISYPVRFLYHRLRRIASGAVSRFRG